MYFIKDGTIVLTAAGDGGKSVEVATRKRGDVLGELSMLLGAPYTVTATASGPASVIEVEQSSLLELLKENPANAGLLFKSVAIYLSDRVAELGSKMRNNVVKGGANTASKTSTSITAADISRARSLFNAPADKKLLGVYQCSVRKEVNAVKEQNAHFGDLYIFEHELCFDLKMFAFHKQMKYPTADIAKFLKSDSEPNAIELQLKGASIELIISEHFDEAVMLMEAARVQAKASALAREKSLSEVSSGKAGDATLEDFHHMVEPLVGAGSTKGADAGIVDLQLQEEDWASFMGAAKQRRFRKGEYVIKEGQQTATLYQVVSGALRVELHLESGSQAVVVGMRRAGEMLGETSLLKEGIATASVAADEDSTVIALSGKDLQTLFKQNPKLPSRFYCFLAGYTAERLVQLTETFADSSKKTIVTAPKHLASAVTIKYAMWNPAYCGIFQRYLAASLADAAAERKDMLVEMTNLLKFYLAVQAYKELPDRKALAEGAKAIHARYFDDRGSTMILASMDGALKDTLKSRLQSVVGGGAKTSHSRAIFNDCQAKAIGELEAKVFEDFLGSPHYNYIIELESKKGVLPSLDDFKVLRVLGEGGFGQVIEVVKRDCGARYAMKVMQKEAMKQNLGSSWRKKIASEQHIMAILHHPFLVNLKYAFQNAEFLILVMDLVSSGDLSEFVLTKRRLTPVQVHWVIMEVVEVMGYVHQQRILYRDLKPENLLIDDEGHVRLIDMGLAAKITDKTPTRTSRVGTDCYMAPEVRWCRRRHTPYGASADWYTVGVLTYEFTHGALPFTARDTAQPIYRGGEFPSAESKLFTESMLEQDWQKRLGTAGGAQQVKDHAYFKDVDWEIVSACTMPSPMKGVKGVPKRKKDKEIQAQRTAGEIAEADRMEADSHHDAEYSISSWDYAADTAITEEYMASMYQCVSAI